MNTHQKFLEFNGKNIVFLSIDGTYWIALKPICEALNVDVRRSRDIAKKDPILGPELRKQALQVGENGGFQARQMTCLPEKFIYGWLFSLRGNSEELIEYKKTCYELLYNHFHGTITNRKELLLERIEVDKEIGQLKQTLKEQDERYKQLKELENKRKSLSTQLNIIDKELIKQPELFPSN
jgi:hypothetical protein